MRLSGKVIYESGAPVQMALVYIENLNKSTYTDDNGDFIFNELPKGKHSVFIKSFENEVVRVEVELTSKSESIQVVLKEQEGISLEDVTVVGKSKIRIIKLKLCFIINLVLLVL